MIFIILFLIILLLLIKSSSKESFTFDNLSNDFEKYSRESDLEDDKDLYIIKQQEGGNNIELRTFGQCHWWPYLQHIGPDVCNRLGTKYIRPVSLNCPAGYAKPLCARYITK
jgi:hypothetical protein